jgi:predicted metal-binding protein
MDEKRLDLYVCTKSKCAAKRIALRISADDTLQDYNGPALLAALVRFVHEKNLADRVGVHEATCMSGCPVGPRMDLCVGSERVMYFRRFAATGRADLVAWTSIKSVESEIETKLL